MVVDVLRCPAGRAPFNLEENCSNCEQSDTQRTLAQSKQDVNNYFIINTLYETVSKSMRLLCLWMTFAFISPILTVMAFGFPIVERRQFVVTCKRCSRAVPAGVKEFPFQSIVVPCPLCGEQRKYLPSEIALGSPHHLVTKQARLRVV
jgi:hypothetical protein